MNSPDNLFYSKTHEWVDFLKDDTARVGITWHAQHSMGDIVFVNLPDVGDAVTASVSFGDVESVKAVSDLYSPLSGTVAAVNEQLLISPELINADPYQAWLIEVADISDKEQLLESAEYAAFCGSE